MKIKLDENLSWRLKAIITEYGHDVSTAADENLLGKRDVDIALATKEEGRMIFSLDRDFADLIRFPPGTHPGMIVFRPKSRGPNVVNSFVIEFIKKNDLKQFEGCIVIVDTDKLRLRRP